MLNEKDMEQVDNTIDLIKEISEQSCGLLTRPPLVNFLNGHRKVSILFEFDIDSDGWRKSVNAHAANVGRRGKKLRDSMESLPSLKMSNDERLDMGMEPKYDSFNPIPINQKGDVKKTEDDIGKSWAGLMGMMGFNNLVSGCDECKKDGECDCE